MEFLCHPLVQLFRRRRPAWMTAKVPAYFVRSSSQIRYCGQCRWKLARPHYAPVESPQPHAVLAGQGNHQAASPTFKRPALTLLGWYSWCAKPLGSSTKKGQVAWVLSPPPSDLTPGHIVSTVRLLIYPRIMQPTIPIEEISVLVRGKTFDVVAKSKVPRGHSNPHKR